MKTKVYYQEYKALEILGDKAITGYGNYTIKNFSDNLKKYISYVKDNNENKIFYVYEKIFNKKTKNTDYAINEIYSLIEKTEENNDKDGLYKIYDILYDVGEKSKDIDEIKINDVLYNLLTTFSKRKLIIHNLKKDFPQKEGESLKDYKCRLKKKIQDIVSIYNVDEDIVDNMYALGLKDSLYKAALEFSKSGYDPIFNISNNADSDENIELIIEILEESGINKKQLEKLKELFFMQQEIKPTLSSMSEEKINGKQVDNLSKIETVDRNNIADFNPFLLSLDIETGFKALGYNRFLEIYEKIFLDIANKKIEKLGGEKPSFYKFLKFDTNKLQGKKESEKKSFTYQYILEFDVKNFDIKKLKELAILLNEEIGDINLSSPDIDKTLKHPLTTIKGNVVYDGYFSDSGEGFADENIILMKGENGEQKIRLSISTFSQDEFIYLITQIGYFVKKGKFIDKNQLYFDIYDSYNKTLFNNEIFDVSLFGEKYEDFVRNIILPHSKEGLKYSLKSAHTLLVGSYGTGKSQFLLNMLLNKQWKLKNKEFFLNATTIPLGLQEFKALLLQGVGGIKTRLDQIYQRTGTPIILLVEDIDTIITSKVNGGHDEIEQALTLFLDGLGSLPVNLITTSNDPTKFTERLIRPKRVSKILIFNRPSIEEKKQMLDEHLKRKNIRLNKKLKEFIYKTDVFKEGTASHIAEIVKELYNYIKIEEELIGEKINLDENILENIISKILVSSKDLKEREAIINDWYEEISGHKNNTGVMGFKTK